MGRRRLIQVLSAVLYNANIKGFATGRIYTGDLKGVCVPGLNCYSCPGAVGACPLGTAQSALMAGPNRAGLYVLGFLLLFGALLGRVVCGFLCPFGLVQELLHKIPTRKIKKSRVTRGLSHLKYLVLAVFVVLLPLLTAAPAFCKYICPAGTLQGGIPLLLHSAALRAAAGGLFLWKLSLLLAILTLCVFLFRAFCRFLCPLGAFYALFAKGSLLGVTVKAHACVDCGRCQTDCPMDISQVGDRECVQCGGCITGCPTGAIGWKHMGQREKGQKHEEI